jgi:DNA topoisomerase VI subunit B
VGRTFEEQSSKEVTVAKSDEQVMEEFDEAVNMSAKELEEWLQTEESREVGQKDGGGESRGHESGRRIVEILEKDRDDYTENDVSHMRDVVSYVHRHQAQRPEGDVEDTNWRYSLINWGHDPLK